MIEAVMLVALGFLAALLIALALLPALSRRAGRLAQRRAEAIFPMSLAEISAERDHLRAELAVRERGLERRAESGFAARAGAMEEIGRRDMTIARLEGVIAERDVRITTLDANLAASRSELAATRDSLSTEAAAHAASRAQLADRVVDLAELEARLAAQRSEIAGLGGELAATRRDLSEAKARLAALDKRFAIESELLTQALTAKDTARIALAESGTQLMLAEGQRNEARTRLDAAERMLAGLREEIGVERRGMTSEREAAQTEITALKARIVALEGALARLDAAPDAPAAVQDDLRTEIVQLADAVMAATPIELPRPKAAPVKRKAPAKPAGGSRRREPVRTGPTAQ